MPYYLRSKVSTCRYSIAGFPCLYLGTSLELCAEETNYVLHKKSAIAARFQLERRSNLHNVKIRVIDLAIKPQDYLNNSDLKTQPLYSFDDYLLWYPLIASCSFVRQKRSDPFAAEYIIPQLLMQWVKKKYVSSIGQCSELMGIRYFSCKSIKAANMGFNYVFPSCVESENDYCPVLNKAFCLTKPYYIKQYENFEFYENKLDDENLDHVFPIYD